MIEVGHLYVTTQRFFHFLIDEIDLNRTDEDIWSDFNSIDFESIRGISQIFSAVLKCKIENLTSGQTILVLKHREISNGSHPKILLKILNSEKIGWIYCSKHFIGLEKFNKRDTNEYRRID